MNEEGSVYRTLFRFLSAALLAVAIPAVLMAAPAWAQVQRNFINLGFEQPAIPGSPCRVYITETQVPGWTTSHPVGNVERVDNCGNFTLTPTSGRLIELWRGPRQGVSAREGGQFSELNAVVASRISQSVCLLAGEQIEWHFSHRGRDSATTADVMEFLIGSQQIVRVGTTNDGDGRLVNVTLGSASFSSGGGGWVDYGGTFTYSGISGQSNIGFGAVSSANGDPTSGNFIDRIDVVLKPFVDLSAGTSSSLEGSTQNLPSLRIVGTVPPGGMNVHVAVTGGTATLGVDYTTPGNATTFDVFVPAGNYGQGIDVPIPVAALTDAVTPEPDETVVLSLVPVAPGDSYLIDSTRACPGTPILTTTWTIRDNAPALQLVKTAAVTDNAPAGPSAGDVIRYSFAVTNTGNQPLTNVTVTDTLPGIVFATPPRSIANLAVGAANSTTFANYATYTVTATDIANGSVTNTATAHALASGAPIDSNPSSVTTPLVQTPGLTLVKTAVYDDGNRGFAQVGDPIAYTFRVTNTGNIPLTGLSITDSMLPAALLPITCPNLAPGAPTATCTHNNTSPIVYGVTQADIEAAGVANTATASAASAVGPVTSNPSSTNTPLVQAARLVLDKTAGSPSQQAAGGTIAYSFRVTNTGNVPLNTIAITDPQLAAPATCPPGILAVGASVTCTGTHIITQAEMDAGTSTNTAQATGLTPTSVGVVSPPDSTSTRLQALRSISVDKRVIRSQISAPTTMVYTIDVRNSGTASFNTLTGIDTLPDGTTIAITNRTGQIGGDTDEVFEPGETWRYEVTFPVTQARINAGGTLLNRATMSAQVASETPVTGTDTATTAIIVQPSFSVTKLGSPTTATTAPVTINYLMTVRNTGNVALGIASVVDQLTQDTTPLTLAVFTGPVGDGGTPGVLDVGEAWIYGASYVVTQANIDVGEDIVNLLTVNATAPNGQALSQSASATTFINVQPRLTVTKSVDKSAISETDPVTGNVLTYRVVLSNAGGVTLTNVALNDVLPDGTTLVPPAPVSNFLSDGNPANDALTNDGNLDVGENWTYTFPFTVTQAFFQDALANGTDIVNTVSPTAETAGGLPVSAPPATAVTTVEAHPGVHLEKIVDQGSIGSPTTLNYAITIENVGNQNLTIAALTDELTGGDLPGATPLALSGPLADIGVAGEIDVGETWTFTASYAATQEDINSLADLVNTVTLAIDQIATPSTATATTTVVGDPHIRVIKTADILTVASAPTTINYTIVVENTGNLELTNITLIDELTGGDHPPGSPQVLAPVLDSVTDSDGDGRIDVGDSWTYTVQYVVTQEDIDSAAIQGTNLLLNTVIADSAETDPATTSAATTILATPSLTLRKSVDVGTTPVPGPLNYTVTLTNTGNTRLTNVVATDTLTTGALPGGIALPLTGPVESMAADGVVELGETWSWTAQYLLTQSDIDFAQDVVNTVTVTSDETPPQTSEAITHINATARLSVLKFPDQSQIAAPGIIEYTVLLYNAGSETLVNVDLEDTLPDGTDLTTPPVPVSNLTNAPDPSGQLDVGEYWTYTIPFTVTPELFQCALAPPAACGLPSNDGFIRNETEPIAAEVPTPAVQDVLGPPALGITTVLAQPSLVVEKVVDKPDIGAPTTLNYTVTLTNSGNQNLNAVSVTDTLAGGALPAPIPLALAGPIESIDADLVLDVGESWTYAASYAATNADIAAGADLVNTVSVTTTEVPGPMTAEAVTTMVAQPLVAVEKTVDKPAISTPEALTYTIAVENIGNVPLTGVTLADTLSNGLDLSGSVVGPTNDADGVLDLGQTWLYTLTYTPSQAEFGSVSELVNTVSVTSAQLTDAVTADAATLFIHSYALSVAKSGQLVDDGDGFSNPGDRIDYSFLVTNTGNAALDGVTPRDPGPSFDGVPGGGTLSPFTPGPVQLEAGQSQTFTASYLLTQQDVDNAAGLTDAVENTADAMGFAGSVDVLASPSTLALGLPVRLGEISLVKQAQLRQIRRGETVPFTITIQNRSNLDVTDAVLTDRMPPAFVFVEGSAMLNGAAVTPVVSGRNLTFSDIDVPAGSELTLVLVLRALPNIAPGTYTNVAILDGSGGGGLAPDAEADVLVVPEAVFDCAEVIGKVFNDIDRDGYQDEGEPGLPGVRIATVRGTLITTDAFGRYSVPCAALPNQDIGSNFVLKLDPRSLPTGFAMTSENPAMARLTAGKMSEINFGASIGRQVRIDLDATAFIAGSAEPDADLVAALDQLIAVLSAERAGLGLFYEDGGEGLGSARLARLEDLIRARWQAAGAPYELVVDRRVVAP